MPKFVYDWETLGPEIVRLAPTAESVVSLARQLNIGHGALRHWCRANNVALNTMDYSTKRKHRSQIQIEETIPPAPTYDAHKTLTSRLMGDPPPGRTPWS